MNAQDNIYEIAAQIPAAGLADQLRVLIARNATSNPHWCKSYDALIEATRAHGLRHPETYVLEPADDPSEPTYLTDTTMTLRDATATMRLQAANLGVQPGDLDTIDDVDLVSSVVAAQAWLAAVNADDLAQAAAKGPDAIAAAAAILARVCGQGVTVMPLDPEWPALRFPQERVLAAVARARRWSDHILGEDRWGEVTARVVTDLGWRAGGNTKTHEASLLLGIRMPEIHAPLD